MGKLLKKKTVDTYKIGVQTISRKDGIFEIPTGAIPLSVNMKMPVLAKNPQTDGYDLGSLDVVVYAQKVKIINVKVKKEE